ncbi:hypothetical protein [Salinibacillus kushneri]|uniref:hypothetical protein n=1 Tax=Salinibacillus kushneri TaxID=237682 RepID=UPI001C65DEFB|nr:hypothetical protein [Salinibacillus kushneri]
MKDTNSVKTTEIVLQAIRIVYIGLLLFCTSCVTNKSSGIRVARFGLHNIGNTFSGYI